MQLTVQGKQLDVGDALRTHVEDKLEDLNQKFFNHATFASVTFAREGHGHGLIRVHIQLRIGKDIQILADATEAEPYGAFDAAAAKAARQLGKYKERLRSHRGDRIAKDEMAYINMPTSADNDDGDSMPQGNAPLIIAELTSGIKSMSVSDAAKRMDASGAHAFVFRSPKSGAINMVYRRADGNISWVDTAEKKREEAKPSAAKPAAKPMAKKPSKPVAKKKAPAKKLVKKPVKKLAKNVRKLKPLKKAKAAVKPAKKQAKRAKAGRR